MNETRHFTARIAIVLAAVTLVGSSAFADSRHPKTTASRGEQRATVQRSRPDTPAPARADRGDSNQPGPVIADRSDRVRGGRSDAPAKTERQRTVISGRSDRDRGGRSEAPAVTERQRDRTPDVTRQRDERRDRDQGDRSTNGSRGETWNRDGDRHSTSTGNQHGKRMPHYGHGRISKVRPHGDGYHVWVGGSAYPFFVPRAYYHPGHFNVGLTIRLGGYYNPRGYYDYYGDYESDAISDERLRGEVDSIDYRRGTFVLDLDGGCGYVTIHMRDRYERVRIGDYVVVYGDWTRRGNFVANYVDVIDHDYRW